MTEEIYFSEGPSGGHGGNTEFFDTCESNEYITSVSIWVGRLVDALQFTTNVKTHAKHGGGGGTQKIFNLDENEFLVALEGRYEAQIDRIILGTNTGKCGVFGGDGGRRGFLYQAPAGWEICGFKGASQQFLDSIGVILRALPAGTVKK